LGVNTRAELAAAERILRDRVRGKLMEAGATFLEPETCFVDTEVRIGRDTVIHPHITLEGRTVIGEDCVIRSHSRLVERVLGDDVFVGSDVSLVAPVTVGRGSVIGAGSVVTEDVPADALALGRARQVVKPGWAKGMREKMRKDKR